MATELRSEQSPPANDLKRRHSEASEQESKRLRASPGKTSPDPEAARATDAPSEERSRRESTDKANEGKDGRRKSGAVNEKDRSRRLFGGLLGSLSQKGDSRTVKKRQEIESRKKAELQRQDDERVEDKQRRLEELAAKRRRVREKMDGETTRNRHRNMLHSAHFLHTSAQPRLLYKPWELRPDEEDRIDDQISRAKSQIDQELSEVTDGASNRPDHAIEESREQAHISPPDRGPPVTGASSEPPHATQEKQPSPSTLATTVDDSAEASVPKNESATADGASTSTGETQREEPPETAEKSARAQDDQDDHVVEGEEDTVIY